MMGVEPLVSIVIATFNRGYTIRRAISSALNQTYKNIELIIIDDGSTDDTFEILNSLNDSRVKIFKHIFNRGVTAAKNSGLKQIEGEWFTFLDSDDEMVPEAIEIMIKIPLSFDAAITAVTCNCRDTTTNEYSGVGLTKNQYLNVNTLMTICKGEFWGITKTSLLQQDSFNEKLSGFESILWYKINERANRYYLHEALRIYHTEGNDRLLKSKYNFKKEINLYANLIREDFFLNQIKKYRITEYLNICKNGLIVLKASNNDLLASKYFELLVTSNKISIIKLIYKFRLVSLIFRNYISLKSRIKPYITTLLKI